MAKNKNEIITDINNYISQNGGQPPAWYVGISKDARDRLFNQHNVDEKNGTWIFSRAETVEVAREIEEYFIKRVGTDGGSGGGDDTADYVYAYKKNINTKQ